MRSREMLTHTHRRCKAGRLHPPTHPPHPHHTHTLTLTHNLTHPPKQSDNQRGTHHWRRRCSRLDIAAEQVEQIHAARGRGGSVAPTSTLLPLRRAEAAVVSVAIPPPARRR